MAGTGKSCGTAHRLLQGDRERGSSERACTAAFTGAGLGSPNDRDPPRTADDRVVTVPGSGRRRFSIHQIGGVMVKAPEITQAEFDEMVALFDDPTFVDVRSVFISVQGQEPGA